MTLLTGERYVTEPFEIAPLIAPAIDKLARASSHLTLASNNLYMPFNGFSSGSAQGTGYRVRCVSPADRDVYGLRLGFSNTSISATGEVAPADAFTVKGTVEVGANLYPFFFDGARIGNIEPGAIRFTDPVGVFIPKGTVYYVRTYASVDTLGKKWPVGRAMTTANGEGYTNSDFSDGALPGTLFAASAFGPAIILGETKGPKSIQYALIGSSSAFGQGDTAEGPNFDYGYFSRVFGNKVAHLKLTRASDTMLQFLTANKYRLAHMAASGITHVLHQNGTNDISAGASVADVKSRLNQIYDMFHGVGLKVIQSTFTPVTGGTWTTLEGQINNAYAANRLEINDWIRTERASGKAGFIDPAIITEARSDRNKWRIDGAAWTADGLHLTQYGHQQVAAALATYDFNK